MGIGDSITFLGCLAGTMLALPALWIFLNFVFPDLTERAAYRLRDGAIAPFFLGLFPLLIVSVPTVILISLGSVFQFIGVLIIFALLMWAFLGGAIVARVMGMRFTENAFDLNPFTEYIGGVFILAFAIAFPIIGWFIILPLTMITGIGATVWVVIISLWNRIPRDVSKREPEMPRTDQWAMDYDG